MARDAKVLQQALYDGCFVDGMGHCDAEGFAYIVAWQVAALERVCVPHGQTAHVEGDVEVSGIGAGDDAHVGVGQQGADELGRNEPIEEVDFSGREGEHARLDVTEEAIHHGVQEGYA